MMTKHLSMFAIAALFLLAGCAATGPISAPIAAGGAALLAVFDQLYASGVMDQSQYIQAHAGVQAMQESIGAVSQGLQAVKDVQSHAITPAEGITGVTGAVLAGMAALHKMRNTTRKAAIGNVKQEIKQAVAVSEAKA